MTSRPAGDTAAAMSDVVLRETTSLCSQCLRAVPGEIVETAGEVRLRKRCPEHGREEALIAADASWYRSLDEYPALTRAPSSPRPSQQGCPFDCGPCQQHEQTVELPIVPITSACNLDCPICYTHNRNEGAWHMSDAELRALLSHLGRVAPERRLLNLTGGEPTQHPDFLRIVKTCHEAGIHRITISTHGLRFLKEPELLAELAAIDARVILSFDSFKREANRAMLGGDHLAAKLRIVQLLEQYGVNTTLLPVLCRGQNDDELGAFVELALAKDFIRSVEFHTMTFTGQSGADFPRSARYTPDQVMRDLEAQTAGRIKASDFVPSPAAHPLCYQVCYLLRVDEPDGSRQWTPFTRFMAKADLRALLGHTLYMEPGRELESALSDVIERLWAGDIACEAPETALRALRALCEEALSPERSFEERLRLSEQRTKAIYLHAHMDAETFEVDRIKKCPVGIREPDGTNVPSCAYNVLYRDRDRRFMATPQPALVTLGRGRLASG